MLSLVETSKVTKPPADIVPDKVFIVDVLSTRVQFVRSAAEDVGLCISIQSFPDDGLAMNSLITRDSAEAGEARIKKPTQAIIIASLTIP